MNSKINVLHLRSNYNIRDGGPEKLILYLAEEIDNSRFNLTVVSLQDPKIPPSDYLIKAKELGVKIEIIPWNKYRLFSSLSKLNELLSKEHIHILHTHDLRSNIISLMIKSRNNIMGITGAHGWVGTSLKIRLHEFIDRIIIRFFDKIIVESEQTKMKLQKFNVPQQRIEVNNFFTGLEVFAEDVDTKKIREQFNLNTEDLIVGTVSRLSAEKNHITFLEAARLVADSLPQTKFVIAGEGPMRHKLEQKAKDLGLKEKVIFTGFYDNLPEVYAVMDLFVLTSLTETGPIVVLEAMTAGKPVIATPVGGVPEIIFHGKTGEIIQADDTAGIAEVIKRILSDKCLAQKLGQAGKKLVAKKFSKSTNIDRLQQIYREILIEKEKEAPDKER